MASAALIDYQHIPDQAWRRLQSAADERQHPMRLMTIATVDRAGLPNARVLVLRGASRERRQLWFHTDARSLKVDELRSQPSVCAVGYDPRDDVQLRMFGRAHLHRDDTIADQHWEQTTMAVRAVYGSPLAPGEPLPGHDPRTHQHLETLDAKDSAAGRRNFLVIAVDIDRIEWVQLDGARQRRARMRRERDWAIEPLAP